MWYSATKVGIMDIDMDHSNLDTMLQLYFSGRAPESWLKNIIEALIGHFVKEEKIIVRMGREFPAEHRIEHQRLTEILESRLEQWQAGQLEGKKIAEEIRTLLLSHVTDFDVHLNPDKD